MDAFLRAGISVILCTAALSFPPSTGAWAQTARPACRVTPDANGMIRGGQIPAGCVLDGGASRDELPQGGPGSNTLLGPCADLATPRYFTPRPTDVVLENALQVCGQLLEAAAEGVLSREHFGPVERPFHPVDRSFEPLLRPFHPLERSFEPVLRRFGPLERHFEPLQRPFGPLERPFGPKPPRSDAGGP